jgi:hypothetical protein
MNNQPSIFELSLLIKIEGRRGEYVTDNLILYINNDNVLVDLYLFNSKREGLTLILLIFNKLIYF